MAKKETIIQRLKRHVKNMSMSTCNCGSQDFRKVANCYDNNGDSGYPELQALLRCKGCNEFFSEREVDKMPKTKRIAESQNKATNKE